MRMRLFAMFALGAALLVTTAPVGAIVTGEDNDQLPQQPGEAGYGLDWDHVYWLYEEGETTVRDGTVVAVGYFYLLTARHYYTSKGDKLYVNGDEYEVVRTTNAPTDPGADDSPDLRLIELRNNTNPSRPLPGYYPLYTGSISSQGTDGIALVGTGYGGTRRSTYYLEDPETGRTKRWGLNGWSEDDRQPLDRSSVGGSSLDTSCFRMEYNSPTLHEEEAGLALGDSGSAALVNVAGYGEEPEWQLAGINLYRESAGTTPSGQTRWDNIWAARVPDYADWIHGVLADDLLPGDVDIDGDVDATDYLVVKSYLGTPTGATWANGDFDGDADVDEEDLFAVETNFGYVSIPHPFSSVVGADPDALGVPSMVPEPACIFLLGAGALALVPRRRPRVRR